MTLFDRVEEAIWDAIFDNNIKVSDLNDDSVFFFDFCAILEARNIPVSTRSLAMAVHLRDRIKNFG